VYYIPKNVMSTSHNNQAESDNTTTAVEEVSNKEKKQPHPLTEIIQFALIALIIVIPVRMFIAQPFIVSGASMEIPSILESTLS